MTLDREIDVLFRHFDDLFCEGEFVIADSEIANINFEGKDVTWLVALLTITWPARKFLSNYDTLLTRVERHLLDVLKFTDERVSSLLIGLR